MHQLISSAIKAASSHNTQPWKFGIDTDRIIIWPDLDRRCPVVDPDDHHLYASLGCALQNLMLAARAAGLYPSVQVSDAPRSIQVHLEPAAPQPSPLHEAIDLRQCSRSLYDGSALSTQEHALLETAGHGEGVAVRFFFGPALEPIAEYVAAGNTAQFADAAWRRELQQWLRFNARAARETGDGLYGPVMGSPDVPAWLGRAFMRVAFSAKQQNRKDIHHIRSSSAVVLFVSERDNWQHWVEAGRCYQRFALQAAALDLRTAFINQPVEVASLRRQFATFLDLGPRRPDLLVRVGRGPRMPASLRRPLESVIV